MYPQKNLFVDVEKVFLKILFQKRGAKAPLFIFISAMS